MQAQLDMQGVPMPVVIQTGNTYAYSEIYSSITVPLRWQGSCADQSKLVHEVAEHFNAFKNGMQKYSRDRLAAIEKKWVCVE